MSMKVLVRGGVSVYKEASGQYQLYVEDMRGGDRRFKSGF